MTVHSKVQLALVGADVGAQMVASGVGQCHTTIAMSEYFCGAQLMQYLIRVCALIAITALVGCTQKSDTRVRIAEAGSVWWNAPITLAARWKSLEEQGITPERFDVSTGLASKNAVVQGTADVGVVAATPLLLAAAQNEEIVILGLYMQSSSLISIVVADEAKNDWLEKPISVVPATISEFYLINYLISTGKLHLYRDQKLKLLRGAPPTQSGAFKNGAVASAVAFEPFSTQIQRDAQERKPFRVDAKPNLYTLSSYLIVSKSYYERNRNSVEKIIKAFESVAKRMKTKPDDARDEINKHFSSKIDLSKWPSVDFEFSRNRKLVQDLLMQEAEVAETAGILKGKPNFSSMLVALN